MTKIIKIYICTPILLGKFFFLMNLCFAICYNRRVENAIITIITYKGRRVFPKNRPDQTTRKEYQENTRLETIDNVSINIEYYKSTIKVN